MTNYSTNQQNQGPYAEQELHTSPQPFQALIARIKRLWETNAVGVVVINAPETDPTMKDRARRFGLFSPIGGAYADSLMPAIQLDEILAEDHELRKKAVYDVHILRDIGVSDPDTGLPLTLHFFFKIRDGVIVGTYDAHVADNPGRALGIQRTLKNWGMERTVAFGDARDLFNNPESH
jgi:hypothetical protein